MKKRILFVEDEAGLIMTIGDRLTSAGYSLDISSNLFDAQKQIDANTYDLLILDVMLPDGDGMEFCSRLRRKKFLNPILMLTARSTVGDRVRGLQSGADDYLCKPFSMSELLARLEALFRRPVQLSEASAAASETEDDASQHNFGRWVLDAKSRTLYQTKNPQKKEELNTTEFRLLVYLINHSGEVLSRDQLLDAVWGYNNEVSSRTVDVHIAWLRQKLEEKEEPVHIHTIRRGGYRFAL